MWNQLRIGTGFDVHAFEAGAELWVGGIHIPHPQGLAGHSDADVLIHAMVDALLGAMGDGDIGTHFPSSDPKWAGAKSAKFLEWTRDRMASSSFELVSMDATIIAQEPKMAPHLLKMRELLCHLLKVEPDRIHVKATTTDHLGFVGRKEGIAAQASCLLYRTKI
jgi:2-C-methyl-D-erythritol 2,4-cyclodiphosphate synthase